MRNVLAILAVLAVATSNARADDAEELGVHGFTTVGAGELHGLVRRSGKPAANKLVRVITAKGEQTATTDQDGKFKIALEDSAMLLVEGPYSVEGEVATGEKVITINAIIPPAVSPKPKTPVSYVPEYSDKAIEDNAWARAWFMVEIDATGKVERVKLLNPPGHGLEDAAIKAALDLKFEPALDRANKPIPCLTMWAFEWPPYWLMRSATFTMYRMPGELTKIECAKPGERHLRNCTRPNISRAMSAPWLTRTSH